MKFTHSVTDHRKSSTPLGLKREPHFELGLAGDCKSAIFQHRRDRILKETFEVFDVWM